MVERENRLRTRPNPPNDTGGEFSEFILTINPGVKMLHSFQQASNILNLYEYSYGKVEQYVQGRYGGFRKDFCGFADIIAFRVLHGRDLKRFPPIDISEGPPSFDGCLAVQACTHSDLQDHIDKLCFGDSKDYLQAWLETNNRFEIWAFPNKAKMRTKKARKTPPLLRVARFLYEGAFYYYHNTELAYFGFKEFEDW